MADLKEYITPEMEINFISFADIIVTSTTTEPQNNTGIQDGDNDGHSGGWGGIEDDGT